MYAPLLLTFALLVRAGITSLDKVRYEDLVSNGKSSLVLFTASGCVACDVAVKELQQAQADVGDFVVGQIDCGEEPVICDDNRIFAVPSLMLSVGDGTMVKYRDRLNSPSISAFKDRLSGPAVKEIKTLQDGAFQSPTSIIIVGLIGTDDVAARTTFETVAASLRTQYAFAISVDSSIAILEGISRPALIVYKPFDDKKTTYTQHFSQEAIEDFLEKATKPLIEDMDPLVYDSLVEVGKPVAFILTNSLDEKYELLEQFYPLANRIRDEITFVTVNTNDYPNRGQLLGLSEGPIRGFAIEDVRTTRAYPLREDGFPLEKIDLFIRKYLSGSLKPLIRSDPVPKPSPHSSSLVTLVGSNFEEFVMDESRDVLVEFSVPWCDYCVELHTVMEKLGKRYGELNLSNKIALARVDVHTNDVPVRITGYPMLILFRAGDNSIVHFNGTFFELLSEEQLASFIGSNGGNNVVLSVAEEEYSGDKDSITVPVKDEL